MKQIVQKIALAFGGILFALALCEGLIWVAPPKLLPPRLLELTQRMALYRSTDGMFIADSELLFKIRPNYDAVVDHPDYHVRVKTHLNLDGIGFRGGSSGGPAWAVAVGDSFTFGVGVEQEDTWVYLLAKALSREIVNLGIPAQGPPQYTRVLKRYGLPMRPKVVFYGFYFNDLDATNRFYRM
ncbi:MAG: SGNH/GDSL hydrolase family protein, partial [Candidatus Binatia bacterium]